MIMTKCSVEHTSIVLIDAKERLSVEGIILFRLDYSISPFYNMNLASWLSLCLNVLGAHLRLRSIDVDPPENLSQYPRSIAIERPLIEEVSLHLPFLRLTSSL